MKGLSFLFVLAILQYQNIAAQTVSAPVSKKGTKVFTEHGHQRVDDYYWMNYPSDTNVINHLKEENTYVEGYMKHTEGVQKKIYEAEKIKQQELEARTVDNLRIGEMQPERDHELIGEKTITGDEHNRKWRMAEDSGYFSFTMKVDPSATNTLICTYWGMDNRGRTFDIYVNDVKIATEDINKYKASKFYDIAYSIPIEVTRYKLSAKIKFVPKEHNSAGPLYGAKIVKGDVGGLINSNSQQ